MFRREWSASLRVRTFYHWAYVEDRNYITLKPYPCFPIIRISMASFRSSIIDNALRRLYYYMLWLSKLIIDSKQLSILCCCHENPAILMSQSKEDIFLTLCSCAYSRITSGAKTFKLFKLCFSSINDYFSSFYALIGANQICLLYFYYFYPNVRLCITYQGV